MTTPSDTRRDGSDRIYFIAFFTASIKRFKFSQEENSKNVQFLKLFDFSIRNLKVSTIYYHSSFTQWPNFSETVYKIMIMLERNHSRNIYM